MHDIFISHATKDKESIVLDIANRLKAKGMSVWLDQNEIRCGESILDRIKEGIINSYAVVLILTDNFFNSFWTPVELGVTLGNEYSSKVIPIVIDATSEIIKEKFPWILTIKYVNYKINEEDDAIEKIYRSINSIKLKMKYESPELNYRNSAKKLHNFNTPTANKISILLTEFDQISKYNIRSALYQVTQIAKIIIDALACERISNNIDLAYQKKLDVLSNQSGVITKNASEHLRLLLNATPDNAVSAFQSDEGLKQLIMMSISSAIEWYASYLGANNMQNTDTFEVHLQNKLTKQDFIDMYEIDKLVLRSDLIAPPEITYAWYQYNNYSHVAIKSRDKNKVIGYAALFPITEELFNEIKSGNFKDNDLSIEHIRQYDMPDFYYLYVSCIAVHPDYQNSTAFNYLYKAIIQMMLDLAVEREVYITEIITEASTLQGEKLCKIIGLHKISNTNLGTSLYQGTLLPPSLRLASLTGSRLIRFYQEKYEEFKQLL